MAYSPLVLGYYGFLALGLGSCLYLFLTLKREIWKVNGRWKKQYESLEAAMEKLRVENNELRLRLQEAEERAGVLVAPTPPRSGLNLSKRSQALRMARRGDAPPHIAAALQLPQTEVDLLLKVHRLAVESRVPELQTPELQVETEPGQPSQQ
jgi:hypothetical protein